ncbi:MAG: hypothetical protein Ta2F_07190 [Termitinemataceae bacterium]|nr:MAG: hypothetical protein Ta2F_07190 [Termitinemataceae bacterium]
MKNKKNNANTNVAISILVVLFCLLGALGSTYLFYNNLNATLTRTDGKIQGQVVWKNHAVQRRFSNRFVWNSVATGTSIYEGDIIRTDVQSDASILLNGGATIDMQENSLIQISQDKWGRLNLQILGGDTTVKTIDAAIILKDGTKEIEMKAYTSLRAVLNKDGKESSFTVDNGSATLVSGDVKQEMNSGTSLSVDSSGNITNERTVTVHNVASPVQQIKTENETTPVNLEWNSNGNRVRLEVASDIDFSNIAISRIQDSNSSQVTLPPGYWWWRVIPIEISDNSSAEGRIIITQVEMPPPKIMETVSSPVVFSFLSNEKPVSTIAEINRIQAVIENKPDPAPLSPPPVPLEAPRLLEPDTELNPIEFKKNKNIRFSWTAVSGARAYLWTLEQGALQTNVIVRETNFIYDASKTENGTYTWRVEALRSIPTTHYVNERGNAAERTWIVRIPMPQKPVLMGVEQD